MTPGWSNPAPLPVPQRLRSHVRAIYGYAASGIAPGVHRGLPSSTLTVVLPIGDPLRTAASWEAWQAGELDSSRLVLGGLHTTSALVVQPRAWAGVQLSVSPLGARSLFGAPAAALPTGQWDARDLLGPVVDRVAERLAAATDWDARYAVVLDLLDELVRRSDARAPVRPEVRRVWELIQRQHGARAVADLAGEVGLSRRRLATLFAAELGPTPKLASRLARFDAARAAVARAAVTRGHAAGSLDLSGIAADVGYFDHAHLVREFSDFAGLSPTAWVEEEFRNVQAGVELHQAASAP